MPSTYVARNASIAVVADEPKPRIWAIDEAPAAPLKPQSGVGDDLGSARGIFVAVVTGAVIWVALGWGAMITVDRLLG